MTPECQAAVRPDGLGSISCFINFARMESCILPVCVCVCVLTLLIALWQGFAGSTTIILSKREKVSFNKY